MPPESTRRVRLTLPGWNEETSTEDLRIWRDNDGSVLSLGVVADAPDGSDEVAFRQWCRKLAASRDAGLIEACRVDGGIGPSVRLIYKRLQIPAYIYTGMLITFVQGVQLLWTVVAGELGTTGVREAVVTAGLMNAGKLNIDDYKSHWAHDPYEPAYQGVNRSVLRFMSDDESYDDQFPQHPLSKIRRVLAALPDSVQFDSSPF
jgi:hypothetical protein